jgi:uncharacterized membrane protein
MILLFDWLIIIVVVSNLYFDLGTFGNLLSAIITMFFAPGYFLLSLLFPKGFPYSYALKLATSVGLSVVLSGSIFSVLSLTEFSQDSITYSILGIVIFLGGGSFLLRVLNPQRKKPDYQRFIMLFKKNILVGISYFIALIVLLGSFGWYWHITEKTKPRFTEFYLLDSNGKVIDYPIEAIVNSPLSIHLGITNLEDQDVEYSAFALLDEEVIGYIESINVISGETWEDEMQLALQSIGKDMKIDIFLWCAGCNFPYRELTLWVDVLPEG